MIFDGLRGVDAQPLLTVGKARRDVLNDVATTVDSMEWILEQL